jgi:tetratricopeptide (TPR) repeat protein
MKVRAAFSLLSILFLAGHAQAGQVDKAKLRELAELPTFCVAFGFRFSSSVGFYLGEQRDRLLEIARLQKRLKKDVNDDERYEILGRVNWLEGREKEADEAFAKAVAFCRQKVREHPEDIPWQVRLGEALLCTDEKKEAEKLLRRSVHEAPNEWRAWLALADCMNALSLQAIFGNKHVVGDVESMASALRELKPTEEQIQQMRRLRNEALRCYGRAIALAPHKEIKPYFRRIVSNWNHAFVEAGLRTIKGEKADPAPVYCAPDLLADFQQIARLSPDDPLAIGAAMFWEITGCLFHDKLKKKVDRTAAGEDRTAPSRSLVDALPEESRKFVRECLERLEQLTKHPNKATVADASEILGEMMMKLLGEEAEEKALEHLRRAVRLDPSRERAWNSLICFLIRKRTDKAVAVARERLRIKDNAHNRFLLARVFSYNRQYDKAAEELRAGLNNDPKDPYCRLGLIALRLRREDAESLKEAGKELTVIYARIEEEKKMDLYLSYAHLCGIYYALIDRPEKAQKMFQQILQWKKDDKTATRALAALGFTG